MTEQQAAMERAPLRPTAVLRFLRHWRIEKVGRWRDGDKHGWRFCVSRRDNSCWANCPGPTFLAALAAALRNGVRP
jgi:hypothetical protein